MELALDSIDTETMEIEANAEKLRAHELVKQFKSEMGKSEATEEEKSVGSSEKEIEIEDETTDKEQQKTVGRKEKDRSK
jgi:phage shock protein A